MADFDPFANQGGPAAWDPEHSDDSRKRADELLKSAGEGPGADPSDFGDDGEPNSAPETDEVATEDSDED